MEKFRGKIEAYKDFGYNHINIKNFQNILAWKSKENAMDLLKIFIRKDISYCNYKIKANSMNAKNPIYYSFKRKIRMITRHHQKIHKKTPIIVNNMSLPKSKQKKLWNLWPIIQDIYPVLFILFSISTEFLELKFIRKTMLPKKKRFRFYRFNRTVKHQQKQYKKLPSKFVRTKPVLSQWMADVLEIRALHMLLSQAHTLFSHIHPNQILNHFLNDRIDVESVFIVELSWRKENIRRRYFLIWHLVLKKYEKNTDVEDKVACNQRTYSFFLLCATWLNISRNENKVSRIFLPHLTFASCFQNVPKLNLRAFFVYCCSCSLVHTLPVGKSNFFFNYVKHIQFWNFIMICLGTSSSTYITK